ncbi:MAG: hypothetical protein AAFV45_05450 [Pseudomonadota bacterium]
MSNRTTAAMALACIGLMFAPSIAVAVSPVKDEPAAEAAGTTTVDKTTSQSTSSSSACAEASSMTPSELFKLLKDERKLEQVHKDASYIALQDKATFAMWTFTQDSQAAHPAVVCRVPLKEGDTITLDMVVNCEGPKKACDQLEYDFKELNRRMQMEVEKKARQ